MLRRFGFRGNSFAGGRTERQAARLPGPSGFRDALEELGGIYAAFGRFLVWRSDLLRSEALLRLRDIRARVAPIPVEEAAGRLWRGGGPAAGLADALEPGACWSTPARCAFRSEHQGRPVVVEFAREAFDEGDFAALETNLKLIEADSFRGALQPEVFTAFRAWMRLSSDLDRERSYIESIASAPTLVEYPKLVAGLSTREFLVFEWVEGEPLLESLARQSPEAVRRLAECVLEQVCTLAALDADLDPEALVLKPDGRLAVRRVERFLGIPAALAGACLKYVSAVLASDAPTAAHQLVKLAYGRTALHYESRLLDALSNLEPELKVNVQFPPVAAIFESNWRALKRLDLPQPLFLDILHRNLVAVGYWNADLARPEEGRIADALAEAQWPVLSRLLRTRTSDLFSREVASDWLIGAGLLLFEGLRQASRLADQVRQNEVAVGVDLQTPPEEARKIRRTVRHRVLLGMLLVGFLVSLRLASSVTGSWQILWSAVAGCAAAALFWFVSRIE